MVPDARETPRGTRWSSAHGDVQVETFRIAGRDLKIVRAVRQEKKSRHSARSNYSVLRDDSFFISGFQGLKKFSVKAQLRTAKCRFHHDVRQMMETIVTH